MIFLLHKIWSPLFMYFLRFTYLEYEKTAYKAYQNTSTRSIKTIHCSERMRRFVSFWRYCHWRWFWRKQSRNFQLALLRVRIFILLYIFYDYSVKIKKMYVSISSQNFGQLFCILTHSAIGVVNYWIYIFFHMYICDTTNSNSIF